MIVADKLLLGAGAGASTELSPCLEFVSSTPMTITPKYINSGVILQYSLNGTTWITVATGTTTPSANIIYFRGSATGTKSLFTGNSASNAWIFTGATNLEIIGNINMLIQDILGGNIEDIPLADNCYARIFSNCTSLVTAPMLPATTLAQRCYSYMFFGCTNLTTAPALPATTLASNCYTAMFYGCTNLVIVPALPATTLAPSCYDSMFTGCTSLVTAQALPATALADYCYTAMYHSCASLVTAPTLPSTTLVTNCYRYMFYGCTSLVTAPALPATLLSPFCYANMFTGCTNLVTLPKLPATILQANCYFLMFQGCTKIKMSTTINISYVTAYRIPTTGTGTTASNALVNMFAATGGTFTGTPTINTTYYTENTPV